MLYPSAPLMHPGFVVPPAPRLNSHNLGRGFIQTKRYQIRATADNPAQTDVLVQLAHAVRTWQCRTKSPSNWLPTDSLTRRCDVARELQLSYLIRKAGGYRQVQNLLNLRPATSSTRTYQINELEEMAALLRSLSQQNGLPPLEEYFPSRGQIRQMSPTLANRIASFPGRSGYGRLVEYVKDGVQTSSSTHNLSQRDINRGEPREWGFWTSTDLILQRLATFQSHSRVLPRLCSLPNSISCAIQRQGGAASFAQKHNLILEKDYEKMLRLSRVVRWLADAVEEDYPANLPYGERIRIQGETPPAFPNSNYVRECGMELNIQRCGGRRSLALRLGFASEYAIKGLRMGPMSVRFAADLLNFAVDTVIVSKDGSIQLPSVESLREAGKLHLVEGIQLFGGEDTVGRRLGLAT